MARCTPLTVADNPYAFTHDFTLNRVNSDSLNDTQTDVTLGTKFVIVPHWKTQKQNETTIFTLCPFVVNDPCMFTKYKHKVTIL